MCTSDNPFALGNSSGMSEYAYPTPGAIIYFPLTSSELLCSFDPKFENRNNKEVLKNKEIRLVNIAQIVSANRFIFQKTDDFGYVNEFLNKFPIYRDLSAEI